MPDTIAEPAAVDQARAILAAADVPTVTAYPTSTPGAVRVRPAAVPGSVAVDVYGMRWARNLADRVLIQANAALLRAGWHTVVLTGDSFRADPPAVAARLADEAAEHARTRAAARLVEVRDELDALAVTLGPLSALGQAALRAAHTLAAAGLCTCGAHADHPGHAAGCPHEIAEHRPDCPHAGPHDYSRDYGETRPIY